MTFNSDWLIPGTADGTYSYSGAGPHAVTQIGGPSSLFTLAYDNNGALWLEGTGFKYGYDSDGRTKHVEDTLSNLVVDFEYDGGGERVRKVWTDDGVTSKELRYFGPHYEEYREDGVLTAQIRYVLAGASRVAMVTSTQNARTYFLHPDVQGTIGLVTDESGTVVERTVYSPFGGTYSSSGGTPDLRYGYTGQEHDEESNQIHLGVRQYHFAISRFAVPDATVPDPANPQTLNRYAYALNNPVRYQDPSGYQSKETDCSNTSRRCDEELNKFFAEATDRAHDGSEVYDRNNLFWIATIADATNEGIDALSTEATDFGYLVGGEYGGIYAGSYVSTTLHGMNGIGWADSVLSADDNIIGGLAKIARGEAGGWKQAGAGFLAYLSLATGPETAAYKVHGTSSGVAPYYAISDGVRRSVSNRSAGNMWVPVLIEVGGKTQKTSLPLWKLYSPKSSIVYDARFHNTHLQTLSGSRTPPLYVTPLTTRPVGMTPVTEVPLIKK